MAPMAFLLRQTTCYPAMWLLVVCLTLAAAPAGATPVQIGLDFITADMESTYFGFCCLPGEEPWDYTFEPFDITDPSTQAYQDGGLVGYTKAQAERAVTSLVDRLFRTIDTGDPATTLALAIQLGPVDSLLTGRLLNVIMGNHPLLPGLGESVIGAGYNVGGTPDEEYPVYANLRTLDSLPGVSFTTPESVFNNIAGTTAHEIAHLFNLDHVGASISDPKPIMATGTGADPLSVGDRLIARAFSNVVGTQGPADSSTSLLLNTIGTIDRADFNMDGIVSASTDGAVFLANLGLVDRLFAEGDANGDGLVTASADGALLLASLNPPPLLASATGSFQSLSIPEPTSVVLTATGLLGCLACHRRRRAGCC